MTETCPLTGLKNILVATDGSLHSEKALHEAINLSKSCGTKLHVMYIVEVNEEYEALAPQIVEKADEEAKMFLDAAKNCAEREKVSVNIIVHRGEDPAHFIIEEAKKLKATLVDALEDAKAAKNSADASARIADAKAEAADAKAAELTNAIADLANEKEVIAARHKQFIESL